jgi:putative copper export protein
MKWLILLHVLGATIWAGGHLILSIGFLPKALKENNIQIVLDFEKQYERVGIPALLLQVVTGFWMAAIYIPVGNWLSLSTPHHAYLWIKITLLVCTIGFAIHARLFIVPNLTIEKLPSLAFHIIVATVLAVSFVVTGLSFRFTYF